MEKPFPCTTQLFIKTQNGTTAVSVSPTDTLGDVKMKLSLELNMPSEADFHLKYCGGIVHPSSRCVQDLTSADLALEVLGRGGSRFGLLDDDSDSEEEQEKPLPVVGTPQREEADLWQNDDEDLGMDDAMVADDVAMVVSDEEEMLIRNDAEAAYATIFDIVKDANVQDAMEYEEEDDASDDNEKFCDGDAVEEVEEHENHPTRTPTSNEDYEAAASLHSSGGICERMASKAFAGERRFPSSTDFGRRMGRSFKVGWAPVGSFLQLSGGTTLKRCRPVFDGAASSATGLKYLQIHKEHSIQVRTSAANASPSFALPADGLYETICSYGDAAEGMDKLAFSLLSCLAENNNDDAQFESRQKEAVLRFFVTACEASTSADIQSALSRGDAHEAVFAALTGGDIAKACSIAFEMGEENLAACISTFDAEGSLEIAQQVRLAGLGKVNVPDSLLKIYKLVTGDLAGASNLDWMRQFCVRLMYSNPRDPSYSLAKVLKQFDLDVKANLAPFPSPSYRGVKPGVQSILYRLLWKAVEPTTTVESVINPEGSSSNVHDYRLAFSLASCLASSSGTALSAVSAEKVINNLVGQLPASEWHYAVYAYLVNLTGEDSSAASDATKRTKSKALVLRNYHLDDPRCEERRNFLVELVPKEWLSEALAFRAARTGDPFTYISYLSESGDTASAALVVDEVILPSIFRQDTAGMEQSLNVLGAFAGHLSPLSKSILSLFALAKDVFAMSQMPGNSEEYMDSLPELLEVLSEVETTLGSAMEAEKSKDGKGSSLKFSPFFDVPPLVSMISEALEYVTLLKVQLKALASGIEIGTSLSKSRLTTLAWLTQSSAADITHSQMSVIRGLR